MKAVIPIIKSDVSKYLFFTLVLTYGLYLVLQRLCWMWSEPFPLDYSGFYYLQEFLSHAEKGHGYYTQYSPFFSVLGGVTALGFSPVVVLYGTIATSYCMLLLSLLRFCWRGSRDVFILSVFVISVCTLDSLFLLTYGYPRQTFSLALLLFATSFIKNNRTSPFQLFLIVLAASCHVLAALGAIIILSFITDKKVVKLFSIAIVAGLIALHFFTADRSFQHVLSFGKVSSLTNMFSHGWISTKELLEYQCLGAMIIVAAIVVLIEGGFTAPAGLLLFGCCLLLAPIWSEDLLGYALRALRTSAIVAYLFFFSVQNKIQRGHYWLVITLPLLCVLSFGAMPSNTTYGNIGPLASVGEILKNKTDLQQLIPINAFVLAPHGVQFQVTYLLQRSSAHELPKKFTEGSQPKIFLISEQKSSNRNNVSANTNLNINEKCVALDFSSDANISCYSLGRNYQIEELTAATGATGTSSAIVPGARSITAVR